MSKNLVLLKNARLIDGLRDHPIESANVLIEGKYVREVSEPPIKTNSARVIDLKGKTLMPGLIDCHTHVTVTQLAQADQALLPDSLIGPTPT
jgi:imidazolonepropionase-like amidohydrolase